MAFSPPQTTMTTTRWVEGGGRAGTQKKRGGQGEGIDHTLYTERKEQITEYDGLRTDFERTQ